MTAVRAVFMAAIILALALTPALVRGVGLTMAGGLPAYASTMQQRHPEKDDNKKHGDNGNDNHGNNNNSHGNGNDNNGNSNDNGDSSAPAAPRQSGSGGSSGP